MGKNISFHDFSITGLLHDRHLKKLFIQTESTFGNRILLQFSFVVGWDLSPFEDQNILFNVQEFDKKNLPNWIKTDFNVPKEYLDYINSGEKKLFYLEPSVGLGGYIVANAVDQTEQNHLDIHD